MSPWQQKCLQCDEETHRLTLLRFVQHHQKLLHKMKEINSSGPELKKCFHPPLKTKQQRNRQSYCKGQEIKTKRTIVVLPPAFIWDKTCYLPLAYEVWLPLIIKRDTHKVVSNGKSLPFVSRSIKQ